MKQLILILSLAPAMFLCGCTSTSSVPQELCAKYAEESKCGMDSSSWEKTPAYPLTPRCFSAFIKDIQQRSGMNDKILEKGSIKLLWNEKALYVRCDAEDSDLVDEAKNDQTHLFAVADTIEVFLHPKTASGYFEIYGSAGEHKTAYFFPGRGRLSIPSNNTFQMPGLGVKVKRNGTLNLWTDRDKGFSMIIRIPAESLVRFGAPWNADEKWSILVVRWNYSKYLPAYEISVTGNFPASSPHIYEDYAILTFLK